MEATTPSGSSTQTQIVNEPMEVQNSPAVRVKLRKPPSRNKVKWSSKTIDNENMGKKKSKCCCIYVKPEKFGDPSVLKDGDTSSSSESSDDDCHNCHGHKGKDFMHRKEHSDYSSCDDHESREKTPPITFAKIKVLPLPKNEISPSDEPSISSNKEDNKSKESSNI